MLKGIQMYTLNILNLKYFNYISIKLLEKDVYSGVEI